MAGIEKRGEYRPRRQREQQAYRLVLLGSGTGIVGVVTFALWIVGVTSVLPAFILLLITVWCVWRFMRVTARR